MKLSSRQLSARCLKFGILIFVLGVVFTSSGDILSSWGATVPSQAGLFSIAEIIAKVFVVFGMPFAAGLICLAIAFRYIPGERGDKHDEG